MERGNFYDRAGLQSTGGSTMLSTHVGDDLAWGGFQEGMNAPVAQAASHPSFGPSAQLIGFAVLALFITYMDRRIKLPIVG
jgi:hypothetical protein